MQNPKVKALAGLFGLSVMMLLAGWFLGLMRPPNPKLGKALQPIARVSHPEANEISGLVQSRIDPERLWIHNDSGDWPRLFALTAAAEVMLPETAAQGKLVAHPPQPEETLYRGIAVDNARLVDWEDIACHGDRLYIADLGNNLNSRRDLGIYEVLEPDPRRDLEVQARSFIPVRYPDQTRFPPLDRWDFDCEAIFWWGEHLYVVTKTRPAFRLYVQGDHASLYRLDSMDPQGDNVLSKVDKVDGLGGWVSAADVSHDERYLALLIESPVQSVWLFERPSDGDRFFSQAASVRRQIFHGAGQAESLAFFAPPGEPDGEKLLILNEGGELFELLLDEFETVPPPSS